MGSQARPFHRQPRPLNDDRGAFGVSGGPFRVPAPFLILDPLAGPVVVMAATKQKFGEDKSLARGAKATKKQSNSITLPPER